MATLSELYECYAAELRSFVASRVGPDLADDVAGDLWLRAVRAWPTYHEQGHARAWLYRLAMSACVDALRYHARRPSLRIDARDAAEPLDIDSRVDAEHLAASVLSRLGARQARAIFLKADGYSLIDGAGEMGITVGAYKGLIRRAREGLGAHEQ